MVQQLKSQEMKRFVSFEENVKQYSAKRKEYKKRYPNQFVAVLNGKVILHSKDLGKLLQSVKEGSKENLGEIIIDQLKDKEKLIL